MPSTNKNILVTGGTGFVGTWMERTAPKKNSIVYLNSEDYYNSAWEIADWDYVVHLAPISPSRFLKYAQKHNTKVLFASSGVVYEGMGDYAYNKRLWEKECSHSGANVVIARLFTTSGLPFQKNKALSIFIQNSKEGIPIHVWNRGNTVRSYLYGEDVGRWFWTLLLEGKGAYDVGSSKAYTMLEVASLVSVKTNQVIQFVEHKETPTPTRYIPDDLEPAYNLGCKETIDLPEVIERMIKNEA
jgi:nucleoside-diphosphate-sugar epimerase